VKGVSLAALAVAGLGLAGCGGASKQTATSASSVPRTASGTASAPAPTPGQPKAAATTPQPAHMTTTGASNVRLPATFTITAGGRLVPRVISAPAGVTVELTVISGDHKAHRVALYSTSLAVPAGGKATALLVSLHNGRYPIEVDYGYRGVLVIGAQPGP
jgi:hypothetical protein